MSQPRPAFVALALPASCLLAASQLLGCAAHDQAAVRGVAAVPPRDAAPMALDAGSRQLERAELHEVDATHERLAHELRLELDRAWDEGQALWLAGELEAASEVFDAGLEAVLASGIDARSYPELRRRTDDVLAGVHGLAVEEALRAGDLDMEAPDLPTLAHDGVAPIHVASTSGRSGPRSDVPEWLVGATGAFTIPMEDHPAVEAMVRFYTEKRKEHLETGLRRVGLYGPTVARIFEEEGVPADLMWLGIVESNFNPQAYSRARAKGLWQFIPATGLRYGLAQDFWVDERADFEKATRSSARYMKTLHGLFGDWHLALAAYNAGEGKVGRGIARTGVKDYWHLRNTSHIRPETKSYVPAMLAVMKIVREPERYGVDFSPEQPLSWDVATLDACADLSVLAELADTTVERLQQLNPELRRGCTPGDAKRYALRVPAGSARSFGERFARLPAEKRLNWARHRVAPGESLSLIARRYDSSVGGIMAANKLSSANRIGVGWTLLIPRGDAARALPETTLASAAPTGVSTSASASSHSGSRQTTRAYRVRPGDTLAAIARRHETSASKLASLNRLADADRIRPGQRLLITGTVPVSRSGGGGSGGAGGGTETHTVRPGDTLIGIAKAHGVEVAQIREWNGLPSRGYIHPGQRLVVKGGKTYSVRSGDTLSEIARRFRTSVAQLRQWNDLNRSGLIRPGDRLTIFTN